MATKQKTFASFYRDIDALLTKGAPIDKLVEMIPKYDIDPDVASEYLARKRKENTRGVAISMGKEALEQVWLNFDTEFINEFQNIVLYRHGENNEFYEYENGVYTQIDSASMLDKIDWMMTDRALLGQRVSRTAVKGTLERIGSTLARAKGRVFTSAQVKHQKFLLNLKNGLFDVASLTLHSHTPLHFSTSQVPFDYEPTADCPNFMGFVRQVASENNDNMAMLQEMFGYCLLPGNPQHKAFLLFGDTARNGKSTTAKILCGLLGDDNVSYLSIPDLTSENSPSLMTLEGKQLNFSDEVPTRYIESPRFASMISEGKIMINPKYKTPYFYQPVAKYILTCNDIPRFRESQAMVNRFIIIPFDYQIPSDKRVADYHDVLLQTEGSGILNWALAGAKLMQETSTFTISERSEELAHENKLIGNPVYSFLEETYEFGSGGEFDIGISADMMFGERESRNGDATGYREFCVRNNIGLINLPQFRREVSRFAREHRYMNQRRIMDTNTALQNKRLYFGLHKKDDIHQLAMTEI